MTCPYCNQSFPLTWGRYVKSPLGKHTCPACGKVSRLGFTASYFVVIVVAWILILALAFLFTVLIFPKTWRRVIGIPFAALVYIIGCVVLIPFDKFFDARFRKLKKLKDEKIAA